MASPEASEGATPRGKGKRGGSPKVLSKAELSMMMKETMEDLLDSKLKSIFLSAQDQGSPMVSKKAKR